MCMRTMPTRRSSPGIFEARSEEHTSELQSLRHLVCRLLLEKKKLLDAQAGRGYLEVRKRIAASLDLHDQATAPAEHRSRRQHRAADDQDKVDDNSVHAACGE